MEPFSAIVLNAPTLKHHCSDRGKRSSVVCLSSAFGAPYRLLRQIRYLLATKRSLRHRTSYRPDKYRHTVNKLGTRGGAFIRVHRGGIGAKVNLVSFEFVHRRLVLEHNKLAVVLKSDLKPGR